MTIPIDQDYLSEPEVYQFIAVLAHPQPVIVRTPDFKVNVTHILKVAEQEPQIQQLLPRLRRFHYKAVNSVNKSTKYKGTYVDFDITMGLCQKYDLVELESRIQQIYSNRPILRTTLPSNELDIKEQPSEVAGQIGASFRPDSALLQEWREGQQTEPISSPDNSDPEDDQTQGNNSDKEYLISDTSASKSSISLSEAFTEQESEHLSVRLKAKTTLLHQHTQYSLRKTDSQSSPAIISYYKSRDY